ncbi:MAG: DUF3108 domain-containing protein [Paludibacteraceae bacterium]|nr:DUF3108 domain-containing protein [Paludibacteraceae bacterium]
MKIKTFIVAAILSFVFSTLPAKDYVSGLKVKNTAFIAGEKLDYIGYFQWGIVIDGVDITSFAIKDTCRGKDVYRIDAVVKTTKTIKTFFALCDTFRTKITTDCLEPMHFYEHDKEKKYEAVYSYKFFPSEAGMYVDAYSNRNGTVKREQVHHKGYPMDPFSLLYRIRNIDFASLKEGDNIWFDSYVFQEPVVTMCIQYLGKETVKLRSKKTYEAMKFKFNTSDGTLFSSKNPVYIWIETAHAHRLVHAEVKLKIGYAKIDIK